MQLELFRAGQHLLLPLTAAVLLRLFGCLGKLVPDVTEEFGACFLWFGPFCLLGRWPCPLSVQNGAVLDSVCVPTQIAAAHGACCALQRAEHVSHGADPGVAVVWMAGQRVVAGWALVLRPVNGTCGIRGLRLWKRDKLL